MARNEADVLVWIETTVLDAIRTGGKVWIARNADGVFKAMAFAMATFYGIEALGFQPETGEETEAVAAAMCVVDSWRRQQPTN